MLLKLSSSDVERTAAGEAGTVPPRQILLAHCGHPRLHLLRDGVPIDGQTGQLLRPSCRLITVQPQATRIRGVLHSRGTAKHERRRRWKNGLINKFKFILSTRETQEGNHLEAFFLCPSLRQLDALEIILKPRR